MKPQPEPWGDRGGWSLPGYGFTDDAAFRHGAPIFKSRFGKPGDRLWVRETFAKIDGQTVPWIETDYRATYQHGDRLGDTLGVKKRWSPAIHMPRTACRLVLEITAVRVERLQEISDADAKAEGITPREVRQMWLYGASDVERAAIYRCAAVEPYRDLWEEINGAGSWAANPWVWVVEFRRLS